MSINRLVEPDSDEYIPCSNCDYEYCGNRCPKCNKLREPEIEE